MKEELLITVLASKVKESAREVKSRVSALKSAATIVPSRRLVEFITPVPFKTLVRVRVEILAESKLTVLPLKLKVKEEPLMTVLASSVNESAKAVKSRVSAETSPFTIVPSRMLVEVTTPVPMMALVKVRVLMEAESKRTELAPLKERLKEELEMTVLASRVRESANSVKFRESALISAATIVPSRILVEVTQPVQFRVS